MATEHTAVGVRRKVKLLVPISGRPVVVHLVGLHSRTLLGVGTQRSISYFFANATMR